MEVTKAYACPFVLDEPKLQRIHGILETAFNKGDAAGKEEYNVSLKSGTRAVLHSLEEVIALDNTRRDPIVSLDMRFAGNRSADSCDVDFSGEEFTVGVRVRITASDHAWGSSTFSLIEEQVERILQRGLLHRIGSWPASIVFLVSLALLSLPLAVLAAIAEAPGISRDLWLTDQDIEELSAENASTSFETVFSMQLRNLREKDRLSPLNSRLRDWRTYAVSGPVVLVVAAIMVLLLTCYPASFFNWGDMTERFNTILQRRRFLMATIIIAVCVGVVSSFAVLGLAEFARN